MRRLPDWIKSYLEYTAYLEAPEWMHFWTAVVTIGGALRRKIYFDQLMYQWTPNFYVILVAPPGIAAKSTTAAVGTGMLLDLNIPLGPNALTWQTLPVSLESARIDWPLPDGAYYPMCCLTFVASELGTFLDPSDRSMIDFLVETWDAKEGSWTKATKTQGSDTIINPWVNILACTTPTWLAQNFPRGLVGGGFTSRCIFIFADAKRRIIPYPRQMMEANALNFTALRDDLVHDLGLIAKMSGEYKLDPYAEQWGEGWYEEHNLKSQADQSGFAARMQSHAHKLAMVLAASKSDDLIITLDDLAHATRIIEKIGTSLPQIFRPIDTKIEQMEAERVIDYICTHGDSPESIVYSEFMHMLSYAQFSDAILAGVQSGKIERVQVGPTMFVRGT